MGFKGILKSVLAAVLIVAAAFLGLGLCIDDSNDLSFKRAVVAIIVVFAVLSYLLIRSVTHKKKKEVAVQETYKSYMTPESLEKLCSGNLPQITNVPVILGTGEVAHYFAPARRYITKTKAVGRTGGSGGISVRIAKGVSVHSGRSASQTVYGEVTDTFNGNIVLTNRRLVFISQENGFDLKLSSISAIIPGPLTLIQSGAKSYTMDVAEAGYFCTAINLALEAQTGARQL